MIESSKLEDVEKQSCGESSASHDIPSTRHSFESAHLDTINVARHRSDGDTHESKTIQTATQTDNTPTTIHRTKSRTSTILHRATSHLTTHSLPPPGPPPDGGRTAWLQAFCAFLTVMTTWGLVNSFGAFQTYYETSLPQSRSTISWIGSVQASSNFFISCVSGRALDAGYFLPTFLLGMAVQLLGLLLMSFSKAYWQLLLTQGVLTGLGGGLFFCPSLGLVSTYFSTHRPMAIGLATTGNAIGGIVYPLVVRQLLPQIGFAWTTRVLCLINLLTLSFAAVFMRPRLPPRKSGPVFEKEALKDKPYVLFTLGAALTVASLYFPFFYAGSFARDVIHLPFSTSLTLLIILNGVGIPFRIFPGIIASRRAGVLNMYTLFLFLNAIMLFGWLAFRSSGGGGPSPQMTGYYVWVVFYGATSAGFQSLWAASISSLHTDLSKTGTRLGMAFSVVGVAALVGGPIAGGLLGVDGGSYIAPRWWAAASTLLGAILTAWVRGLVGGWGWVKV